MAEEQVSTQKEHIGVAVIVTNSQGEVLLGERINAYRAGWFGLPGGRIELQEAITDAAKRELEEECGLAIEELEYVGVVRELQDSYNFIHFGMVAKNVIGEPENKEPEKCKGWEWYSFEHLPQNILPGHKAIIEIYINRGEQVKDLV